MARCPTIALLLCFPAWCFAQNEPAKQLTIDEVAALAGKYFCGANLEKAVAVAWAESMFKPKIIHVNRDGSKDFGLWQMNNFRVRLYPPHDCCSTPPVRGCSCNKGVATEVEKDALDPAKAAEFAFEHYTGAMKFESYKGDGWRAWSSYRLATREYKTGLGMAQAAKLAPQHPCAASK